MKQLNIRITDDLDQRLKGESKVRALSRTDLILKALEHFLTCTKAEKEPNLREIINAYENIFCSYCSSQIPRGQRCLWGKDEKAKTIYICSSCELTKTETDQTIASRVIKRRVLDRQIKALQNRLEALASEYEQKAFLDTHNYILDQIGQSLRFLNRWQTDMNVLKDYEEREVLENVLSYLQRASGYMTDFQTFYERWIRIKSTQREKVRT